MEERIKKVMAAVLDVDPGAVREDSSPKTLPSWDSLRHMNLMLALEDEFAVRFDEDQMVGLTSFGKIRDELARLAK